MNPKVSVLLPVYNAGSFLREAVESILRQTFEDFELIIIDDGSTDGSAEFLDSFSDPRIRVIHQTNQGLRATLNTGLQQCLGTYIARMDHDDVALPQRLARQVAFLDTHPDHVLVGTTYAYIDDQNRVLGVFPALLEDADIKLELLTKSPFGHGTVMFRASALRAGHYQYTLNAVHVEDYDLWIRLAAAGKYANLPDVLYLWRRSATNTTNEHGRTQQTSTRALRAAAFHAKYSAGLLRWPKWNALCKYRNEQVNILGEHTIIQRRGAHASLYLVLASLLANEHHFFDASRALVLALLISPTYVLCAGFRHSFRYS